MMYIKTCPVNYRTIGKKFMPQWLSIHSDKTKIAAGLACGMIWTVSKGLKKDSIVLCPDGLGKYYVGEISSVYYYSENQVLPHRRKVRWLNTTIERSEMSQELQRSTSSYGTTCDISKYFNELENLIGNQQTQTIISNDETIEDPAIFGLEKYLEEFLVKNWKNTALGGKYEIDGEMVGQQFQTDTGKLDILGISKDKSELLVIELKKGRASDTVVGQIQRYMGYIQEELLEENQTVKGIIIALEDDTKIRRALSVAKNIDFFRYQVSFKLYQ